MTTERGKLSQELTMKAQNKIPYQFTLLLTEAVYPTIVVRFEGSMIGENLYFYTEQHTK